MQPCASAARLRGGGPILQRGMRAIGRPGSPPPRIVIASPPGNHGRTAKPSRGPCFGRAPSRRRTQDDTVRRLAGGHQTPQRDEQLARQRHDHGLARAAASVRRPHPVPGRQTAGLLEPEETPGELDHAAAHARVARLGEPLLPPPGAALLRRARQAGVAGYRPSVPQYSGKEWLIWLQVREAETEYRLSTTLRRVDGCDGSGGRAARLEHDCCRRQTRERPMPQRNDLSRSAASLDHESTLIAVIEMSQSSWLVAAIVPGIERHPLKKLEANEEALLSCCGAGRARRPGPAARRARGRRLRGRPRWFLAGALVAGAWHRSPRDSPDERRRIARASAGEDGPARHRAAQAGHPRLAARRAGSLQHGRDPAARGGGRQAPEPGAESLIGERTRIINRMRGCLARLGIRSFRPTLRTAPGRLETLRTPEGVTLPPNTLAELRRDMARLRFVTGQITEIEQARLERLQQAPEERPHAMVRLLARDRRRHRDGGHAGARGPLARSARSDCNWYCLLPGLNPMTDIASPLRPQPRFPGCRLPRSTVRGFGARGKARRARTSPRGRAEPSFQRLRPAFVNVRRFSVNHGTHLTGRVVIDRSSRCSCRERRRPRPQPIDPAKDLGDSALGTATSASWKTT